MGGTFSLKTLYYQTEKVSDVKTAFNVALVAKHILPQYTIPYSLSVETAIKLYAEKQLSTTRENSANGYDPILAVRPTSKNTSNTLINNTIVNNYTTQTIAHFRAYVWDASELNSTGHEFFYASFPYPVQQELLREIESFMISAYNMAKDISNSLSIKVVRYVGVSHDIVQKMKSDIPFTSDEIDTILTSLSIENFDKIVKRIKVDSSIANNTEFRHNILLPTYLIGESGMLAINKLISGSNIRTSNKKHVHATANTHHASNKEHIWEQYLGL